jgi:flavin-dependent dehydrogenase
VQTLERFDVLIVGAGPAGCAAAITLARNGHSAALVCRPQRARPNAGEMLAPESQGVLHALGLSETLLRCPHIPVKGILSAWGSSEAMRQDFLFSPYGNAWLLDRQAFDSALFDRCVSVGVRTVQTSAARGCVRTDEGWELGEDRAAAVLGARFVIDATGRGSHISARYAGRLHSLDRLIATGWESSAAGSAQDWPLIEASPMGWWYSASLPDGNCVVLFMTDADLFSRGELPRLAFLRECLDDAPLTRSRFGELPTATGTIRAPAMTAWRERVAGANWLLAGDSAVSVDPLSGGGIKRALECGVRAGEAVSAALGGDAAAMHSYAAWLEERRGEYLRQRLHYYRAEQRWPRSAFWRRRMQADV